ncbi:MAG: hypothetical protein M3Y87_19955 [Myxococcota bacterium]|nr:hypothetical protein [Myxococcota bacterium]
MRASLIAALLLASCGEPAATPAAPPAAEPSAVPAEAPPAASLASIRERSGCAFESPEALCDGAREHYASSGGWVSDGCAIGDRRTSIGPFAEVQLIGLRHGHERIESDVRVERPLLGGSVREPPSEDATTHVVLAARIGDAWFPLRLFHPPSAGEIPGDAVEWSLDETGSFVTWTIEEGASRRDDPSGYGETTRTLAAVHRGVPMIAAQATIERWRSNVDLECSRACYRSPSPPPGDECSRRCASSVRATRSWQRDGDTVRVGATEVQRAGRTEGAIDMPVEEAAARRLDVPDEWMGFCAFMPVVRAVAPASPPTDAASIAARERALASVQRGSFRSLRGARTNVAPGAPRAMLEIYERGGTGCGGGGCTTAIRFRTIEGSMPEQGVDYFANERGNQVGCDDASLPDAGGSTIVEVAPAISREAIGCGLSGYDGTTRRYWVITRVLDAPR